MENVQKALYEVNKNSPFAPISIGNECFTSLNMNKEVLLSRLKLLESEGLLVLTYGIGNNVSVKLTNFGLFELYNKFKNDEDEEEKFKILKKAHEEYENTHTGTAVIYSKSGKDEFYMITLENEGLLNNYSGRTYTITDLGIAYIKKNIAL